MRHSSVCMLDHPLSKHTNRLFPLQSLKKEDKIMKPIIQAGIVILMIGSLIMPANALLKKSGVKAPIAQGDNVIAGAAVNDAPAAVI